MLVTNMIYVYIWNTAQCMVHSMYIKAEYHMVVTTLHHVGLPSFWTLPIAWCSNQNAFTANGSVPTLRHKRQRCTYSGGFNRKSNSHWIQKNKRIYISKIQQDVTVCRYLFTAKPLYVFRVSIAPIIRST